MNRYEYDFLTGNWQGPYGAAYNAVYEYCRESGWCTSDGKITDSGRAAVKRYQENENYLRIDVI